MEKIRIFHGIYDIIDGVPYHLNGYFNKETREVMHISSKLRSYLGIKGMKFNGKYGVTELYFTFAQSTEEYVETIALCHPYYDTHSFVLGEDIVLGRMKRMRGDVKKIVYEMEEYEQPIYMIDDVGNSHVIDTITSKRIKKDDAGNTIIRRTIYFEPYDLNKRHVIKYKDGTKGLGELMYPYIYVRRESEENEKHEQSINELFRENYYNDGLE